MRSLQEFDHLAHHRAAVGVGITRSDHLGALDPVLELEVDSASDLSPVRLEIGEHDAEVRPIRFNDQVLTHPFLLPSPLTLRDGGKRQQGRRALDPWATLGPCPDEEPEMREIDG
jgi:hypothetical protein